jgi:hypothetical protein
MVALCGWSVVGKLSCNGRCDCRGGVGFACEDESALSVRAIKLAPSSRPILHTFDGRTHSKSEIVLIGCGTSCAKN